MFEISHAVYWGLLAFGVIWHGAIGVIPFREWVVSTSDKSHKGLRPSDQISWASMVRRFGMNSAAWSGKDGTHATCASLRHLVFGLGKCMRAVRHHP
jgi:hypothetical protein